MAQKHNWWPQGSGGRGNSNSSGAVSETANSRATMCSVWTRCCVIRMECINIVGKYLPRWHCYICVDIIVIFRMLLSAVFTLLFGHIHSPSRTQVSWWWMIYIKAYIDSSCMRKALTSDSGITSLQKHNGDRSFSSPAYSFDIIATTLISKELATCSFVLSQCLLGW
jgi:hypothetical protein